MINEKYLLLFEDCRIVEGSKNNLILDLNRVNNTHYIPDSLNDFIEKCKDTPIDQVKLQYKTEEIPIVEEYIEFILENEYGHLASPTLKKHLGVIDLEYRSPELIDNAIICIQEDQLEGIKSAVDQLKTTLLCRYLEVRWKKCSLEKMQEFLGWLEGSLIKAVIFHIDFDQEILDNEMSLLKDYPRLNELHLYGTDLISENEDIKCYSYTIDYIKGCGLINKDSMTINQSFYLESQKYNTCLNKKISIDFDGYIKNCPSMKKQYGHISEITLIDVIQQPEFQSLWNIGKDKIHVCQDCEFRFSCTDCRAFLEKPEDIYSKPLKCGYNPYNGEWASWSKNPNKQVAIAFYEL